MLVFCDFVSLTLSENSHISDFTLTPSQVITEKGAQKEPGKKQLSVFALLVSALRHLAKYSLC